MPSEILKECGNILAGKGLTIATVESATAGRFAYELSLLEVSGKILIGGIVTYDAEVKEGLLQISPDLIKKYTPESPEVTKAMAEALKQLIKSNIQIAITGLTTSGGSENPAKPVGTMFTHLIIENRSVAVKNNFDGNAEEIVQQTIDWIACLLVENCSVLSPAS